MCAFCRVSFFAFFISVNYISSIQISYAESAYIEFDENALKLRGVSSQVAQLFAQPGMFLPGRHMVDVSVNGQAYGKVAVNFDENGKLFIDKSFADATGVLLPEISDHATATSWAIESLWPDAVVSLFPAKQKVSLVLPVAAVIAKKRQAATWSRGGVAGVFNYDAQYRESSNNSQVSRYASINSESGFNANDWIFRSRQSFSRFAGVDNFKHQSAYFQRTFIDSKKTFKLGQINFSNSLFGSPQVLGFQVGTEAALNNSSAVQVQGIAETQSVVEVHQSGVLIYSGLLPAGVFELSDLPLRGYSADLQVTLTGVDGGVRSFTVPASSLVFNRPASGGGLSYGVGKVEQSGVSKKPIVATIAQGFSLGPLSALQAGLIATSGYQAVGLAFDTKVSADMTLSLNSTVTQDSISGKNGSALSAGINYSLNDRVSFYLNGSQRSKGYRELSDSISDEIPDASNNKSSQYYSAGASFATQDYGRFSVSASRSVSSNGKSRKYISTGWSKKIGDASLSLSAEYASQYANTPADRSIYLTVSVPFGNGSVRSYVNSRNNISRGGFSFNSRASSELNWNLSSERNFQSGDLRNGLGATLNSSFSRLSASINNSSAGSKSFSLGSSGGLILSDSGFLMSPNKIGETFGVAKVGEESGVKLSTGSGAVWTNSRGYAVLPSINGFRKSHVKVDTRSLKRNVDIASALREVEPARGSVARVDFNVSRRRRLQVYVETVSGIPLSKGAAVFDSSGNFVTVVGERSTVFIPNISEDLNYEVQEMGETVCIFSVKLPSNVGGDEFYETISASCV